MLMILDAIDEHVPPLREFKKSCQHTVESNKERYEDQWPGEDAYLYKSVAKVAQVHNWRTMGVATGTRTDRRTLLWQWPSMFVVK